MPSASPYNLVTTAGDVEVARYRIALGERALRVQLRDGRPALVDVAIDHHDRAYVVECSLSSQVELLGLAREYADRSQTLGRPAILA